MTDTDGKASQGDFIMTWRNRTRRLWLACLVGCATVSGAQDVRGTVREQRSGVPLSGVLVSLQSIDGVAAAQVLSSDSGRYAVRAPAPGAYRVTAKRIGVAQFVSVQLDLAVGEVRTLDIQLLPLAQALPEVRVLDVNLCVTDNRDRGRIAALWEEARTALVAAQVSLRDGLFEGRLSRYARSLDPRSLRVLEESWGEMQGVIDRPFGLLGADSLSRIGFRHEVGGESVYHALDAAILLSPEFLRDHCFSTRGARGRIGLAFAPLPSRSLPDVAGTVWLDARTFELQFVEYRYTGVGSFPGSGRVGGEVHFTRLGSGAWVTSRWYVRLPAEARLLYPVDAVTRMPAVIVRPTGSLLREEGGIVQVDPGQRRGPP